MENTKESDIEAKSDGEEEEQESFFTKVGVAIKHVTFIPLFIWIIYVTTFVIFPGLTMSAVEFTAPFLAN